MKKFTPILLALIISFGGNAKEYTMPLAERNKLSVEFLETLASERKKGKMSAELEKESQLAYAKEVIIRTLTEKLISDNLTEQERIKLVKVFLLERPVIR